MSPEQILNPFTVTPQSDIYAVGLILYNIHGRQAAVQRRIRGRYPDEPV